MISRGSGSTVSHADAKPSICYQTQCYIIGCGLQNVRVCHVVRLHSNSYSTSVSIVLRIMRIPPRLPIRIEFSRTGKEHHKVYRITINLFYGKQNQLPVKLTNA